MAKLNDVMCYPTAYYEFRRAARIRMIVYGLGGSLVCLLIGWVFPDFRIHGFLGAIILVSIWIMTLLTNEKPFLIPYFNNKFPHCIKYGSRGHAVLRNMESIDKCLAAKSYPPLSSFGFAQNFRHSDPRWNNPADALPALHEAKTSINEMRLDDAAGVLEDIEYLIECLTAASLGGASFMFLIRSGDSISGYEVERGIGFL